MNYNVSQNLPEIVSKRESDEDFIDIGSYIEMLIENRWLIGLITLAVLTIGSVYALVATPIYRSNILIQVEDGSAPSGMLLGNLANALDMKSAATAEIEILRSRNVVSRAVIGAKLDLEIEPKRFPVLGEWIGRGSHTISNPGLFGLGGYTWGAEQISIVEFSLPSHFEGMKFSIIYLGNGQYRLIQQEQQIDVVGKINVPLVLKQITGEIRLHVDNIKANPGAEFFLTRKPLLDTVESLQKILTIGERGKQSGMVGVTLEGPDPMKTAETLNEIGNAYVRQNIERKSEEAEKSLAFLEKQLPEMKANLEKAEAQYNTLRNSRGTVDLAEEAKSILQQSVLSQTALINLKQKRDELLTNYQSTNPIVQAVNQQISTLNSEIAAVNKKIQRMPAIEQDIVKLTRDIKVNTDLYTTLLNSAQQLRLVKASKVGTVRLVDDAVISTEPIRPNKFSIILISAILGGLVGVVTAFARRSLFAKVEDPYEIEQALGLTISAAIPHSSRQQHLFSNFGNVDGKVAVLAHVDPTDLAVESLRSFRTSVQFTMMSARNNIVMITGPTPGVGKSFISVNFASVLASTEKRVLLIDADVRKGYLHRYFGLGRNNGLSELTVDNLDFSSAIHKEVLPNVDFIATGTLPTRPAELLENPNFGKIIAEIAKHYDFVIIDTAPILAVTDAMIVAPHAGAIFNVVRGKQSTIGEVGEAVKRLRQSGNVVAGIVFNDLTVRVGGYAFSSKYAKYKYQQYKY